MVTRAMMLMDSDYELNPKSEYRSGTRQIRRRTNLCGKQDQEREKDDEEEIYVENKTKKQLKTTKKKFTWKTRPRSS